MVADLAAADRVALLSGAERALLASPERPVVLVRRREGPALAPEIAPDACTVGLLLPYSPLHHLLLAAAGRPLVMTSGNLSEEPIAYRDDDALRRLAGIADLFLVHDREIEARADDSVARIVLGRPLVLRRARGFVPSPVAVSAPLPSPGAGLRGASQERLLPGVRRRGGPRPARRRPRRTSRRCAPSRSRWRGSRASSGCAPRSSPTTSTRSTSPPATRWSAPAARGSRPSPSSTTTPTPRPPWPSTPSTDRSWRSPGTGRGLGTDGAAWGGELLLARYDGFERLATFRPASARRRRPRRPGAVAAGRWWRSTRPSKVALPRTPCRRSRRCRRPTGRWCGAWWRPA